MYPILILLSCLLSPMAALAGWGDQLSSINVDANLPSSTPKSIVANLLLYLLAIFTALSVLSFAIYGLMFLFGGANKDMADSARKGVQYSLTGIVIGLSGYIVIRLISELLTGSYSLYF